MTKLETIMEIIEKHKDENITTKELKEYGLSQSDIKRAVDTGRLIRMEKGRYNIVRIRILKQSSEFRKFTDKVFHYQYEEAYHNLVATISLQIDHRYDNDSRIYGLLLKELLKDKSYDFSFINDLWEFDETYYNETYNTYFIQFSKAVMTSKFNDALSYISTYQKEEKTNCGENKISTKLFLHLVSNIVYDKRHHLQQIQPQITNSYMAWKKFNSSLKNSHYEEAIQDLKNITAYIDNPNIPKWIDLLKVCIHMEKEQTTILEQNEGYGNLDDLQRLYKSIENGDYIMAWRFVLICIQQNPDSKDLKNYRDLLQRIMQLNTKNIKQKEQEEQEKARIKEQEKQLEIKKQLQILNDKLNCIIYNPNIIEQLKSLKELLQTEIELNTDEQIIMYENFALDILDTIEIIRESRLDASYFETYDNQSNQLLTRFLNAIQNGDYITAYQTITNEEWIQQTKSIENKKYFVLYKKLLSILNDECNKKTESTLQNKSEESNHTINGLEKIWDFIKKYQYAEAYLISQKMSSEMSEPLKLILDTYLPLLQSILKQQIHSYIGQHEKNMRRGDFDMASTSLIEYQEFIKRTELNRELDYYFARMESIQKEVNTDCFVQKEQLYDYGLYCFEQCEYEECIEIMNRYIELDHDLSAKGYMLRAEAYRVLDSLEDARKDYEKAITIIPEPNAFQKLGLINIQNGDYKLALSNFFEYEKRRPNQSIENLILISNSYHDLGDIENQKKYELRIQYLNQQEWMKG